MKLKTYKKKFKDLYNHDIEEVGMLLSRYGFEYIKNATEFVYMNGGVNRIQKLIDENTPETLQDVIDDLYKQLPYQEFGHIIRVPAEIINRLEAIAKHMGGDA